jgi:hypothetical protein
MRTKALDRFKNRAARISVDLELADVLDSASKASAKSLFMNVDSRSPGLAGHAVTQRTILSAHQGDTAGSVDQAPIRRHFGLSC